MTSVYSVIAVCTPCTVVPRSSATVAMETFMTDESRAMRNWPAASVKRISPAPAFTAAAAPPAPDVPDVVPFAISPPQGTPANANQRYPQVKMAQ